MFKRIRKNQKKSIQGREINQLILINKELLALIFNFKQIIIPRLCLMIKALINIISEVYLDHKYNKVGLKGLTILQKESILARIQNLTHKVTTEINLCLKVLNDSLFFNLLIKKNFKMEDQF